MSTSSRRVVITGLGVINSLGKNSDSFWQSMLQGKSGVRQIQAFDTKGLPVRIAAEIDEFKSKEYVEKQFRKTLKVMARTIELAVASAQLALDDGNVDKSQLDPTRFGVEFGAGLIATELIELGEASQVGDTETFKVDYARWGTEAMEKITPLWMLKYLPNMLACQVSIIHNAQGPNNSITEGDVASLLALGEAYRIIKRDVADFFLVGGADSKVNPLAMVRQCLFEELSHNNDQPQQACKPFDKNRDGIVIGEGGTVLVTEELEHAKKRGANILAEVVGHGAAFDRLHDGQGVARSIQAALHDANVGPDEIDHINAHGLATKQTDIAEAQGISTVFGENSVPVVAVKSNIGNLGAGGGVSELASSILAMHHGTVPPSLNYESADPDCPVRVQTEPRAVEKPYALKLSMTQMGQCSAVVIRRFDS